VTWFWLPITQSSAILRSSSASPGTGGSQRLTRFVGKAKAMEMCLTGRIMEAAEAERSGLVSRVIPAAELIADALKIAETGVHDDQIARSS
jgi:enoyl-CoA hydratase/carnithine racemase